MDLTQDNKDALLDYLQANGHLITKRNAPKIEEVQNGLEAKFFFKINKQNMNMEVNTFWYGGKYRCSVRLFINGVIIDDRGMEGTTSQALCRYRIATELFPTSTLKPWRLLSLYDKHVVPVLEEKRKFEVTKEKDELAIQEAKDAKASKEVQDFISKVMGSNKAQPDVIPDNHNKVSWS